jgi:hypothetical protein
VAYAAEPALVGSSGLRAAVLGMLPSSHRTEDEVSAFVESLVRNDRIEFGTPGAQAVAGAPRHATGKKTSGKKTSGKKASAGTAPASQPAPTHVVQEQGGKRVLRRVRFVCSGLTPPRKLKRR